MHFTQIARVTPEISLSSLPSLLWGYYLEYLWFYDERSWVARAAYTFRVLAIILIIPMIGISLLVSFSLAAPLFDFIYFEFIQGHHLLSHCTNTWCRR